VVLGLLVNPTNPYPGPAGGRASARARRGIFRSEHGRTGVKPRTFIALLGPAAPSPLATPAHQREHPRRIGVLLSAGAADPDALAQISGFAQGLQERGWTIGGNVRVNTDGASAMPVIS